MVRTPPINNVLMPLLHIKLVKSHCMVIAAIILLALAALFGATLLTYILRDKPTPKAIVLAHGLFAASGLIVLLIYALTTEEHPRHWAIVTIFIIVAVVGFYLFSRDIRYKKSA